MKNTSASRLLTDSFSQVRGDLEPRLRASESKPTLWARNVALIFEALYASTPYGDNLSAYSTERACELFNAVQGMTSSAKVVLDRAKLRELTEEGAARLKARSFDARGGASSSDCDGVKSSFLSTFVEAIARFFALFRGKEASTSDCVDLIKDGLYDCIASNALVDENLPTRLDVDYDKLFSHALEVARTLDGIFAPAEQIDESYEAPIAREVLDASDDVSVAAKRRFEEALEATIDSAVPTRSASRGFVEELEKIQNWTMNAKTNERLAILARNFLGATRSLKLGAGTDENRAFYDERMRDVEKLLVEMGYSAKWAPEDETLASNDFFLVARNSKISAPISYPCLLRGEEIVEFGEVQLPKFKD